MGGFGTWFVMARNLAVLIAIVPSFIRVMRSSKQSVKSATGSAAGLPVRDNVPITLSSDPFDMVVILA